ncbi:U-scoloptoxin(16)-Ssd1a [Wyeomyia smithii]|uniref:U-scoloptoxin(16)-Ssd1a n=1 Tax=Wyeomyia smithii TaxID=174621 RepID=UPI002467B424|nr:U-scoloptoxin(16)-Ssd1a [Wyeomyia smithii]
MKTLFISFVVACSVVAYSEAYAYFMINASHVDYPNQCYDPQFGYTLDAGTSNYTEKCEKITCSDNYEYSILGCGVALAGPKCELTPLDSTKQYPDCCPQVKCPAEE